MLDISTNIPRKGKPLQERLEISSFPSQPLNSQSGYVFSNEAEAAATYLVIAWFAISESAALGIFPILSALETSHKTDPAYLGRFFEHGFQHFRDEQRHSNLWCRALRDFCCYYPEVIRKVELPGWLLQVMLKSVGKPHSVQDFAVDCWAFETVLRAFYDVALPRLKYPPLQPIFQTIMRDEQAHTAFGQDYLFTLNGPLSRRQRTQILLRFWRNLAGVVITIQPLLAALDRYQPLSRQEFSERLSFYAAETNLPGSRKLPALITRLLSKLK
jgi:hypothetical protein